MPFLSLIIGALLYSFIDSVFSNHKTVTSGLFLTFIVFVMIFPFRNQFFLSPQGLSEWVYGTVNPFGESMEVAKHLAEVTNKNDFVFVAGSEPQIYYYAERKSSSRFDITYPLNLKTPYREQYQIETISDLEKNPPTAMIVSQRDMSGLWNEGSPKIFVDYLFNIISKNYHVVGGFIWNNDGTSGWQEQITQEKIPYASLLLLVKNI